MLGAIARTFGFSFDEVLALLEERGYRGNNIGAAKEAFDSVDPAVSPGAGENRLADEGRIEDDHVVRLANLVVIRDLLVVDADVCLNGRARSLRRVNTERLRLLASREPSHGDQLRQRHASLSPASVERHLDHRQASSGVTPTADSGDDHTSLFGGGTARAVQGVPCAETRRSPRRVRHR